MNQFTKYADFLMYYSGLKWYHGPNVLVSIIQKLHGIIFLFFYFGVVLLLIVDTPAALRYGGVQGMDHFTIIVVNLICLLKIRTFYTPAMKSIIAYMDRRERFVLDHSDGQIRRIYTDSVKYAKKIFRMFVANSLALIVGYDFITAMGLVLTPGDVPVEEWPLQITVWSVKLNRAMYYLLTVAYCLSAEGAGILFATADCIIIGMVVFFIGDLKMLRHLIEHQRETDEMREYRQFCGYVKYHQTIIHFIQQLDESIKQVMLLEFLMRSAQIAVIVLQMLEIGFSYTITFPLNFLVVNYSQLFLYYWHANELTLSSTEISVALFHRKWYNSSSKVNTLARLMMMRAQKPLALHIGSFGVMSTSILVNINKSIFSWLSLMRQFMTH